MSTIDRRYCIVEVDPHTHAFRSVAAIRNTIEDAAEYIERMPDELRQWYVIWGVYDFEGSETLVV